MKIELLSLIVPVYKKEKTIEQELLALHEVLKSTNYNFEIIAVVDGTNLDKSLDSAKKAGFRKKEIKAIGYKNNKGKGQAVRFGMQKAKGDVVMFIDSGGDINPAGIIMLLEHMKWYNADIIIGSKMHPASKVHYPLKRKILSFGYYYFVKLLFGLKTRDTQTGIKAYKRKVIDKVLERLVVKRFAFDIEILAVANKLGFKKIYDAPVEIKIDFNDSSIAGLFTKNGIWPFVRDTIAVWYRMNILHYYSSRRDRVKVFDEDLQLYINNGDMKGNKQVIINIVNNFWNKLFFNTKEKS
jgi:glycosyltransferase involved in cell wall biosynthesis